MTTLPTEVRREALKNPRPRLEHDAQSVRHACKQANHHLSTSTSPHSKTSRSNATIPISCCPTGSEHELDHGFVSTQTPASHLFVSQDRLAMKQPPALCLRQAPASTFKLTPLSSDTATKGRHARVHTGVATEESCARRERLIDFVLVAPFAELH